MQDDVYLTAAQVRARYGDISDVALWNWLNKRDEGFVKPIYISRRRYWLLRDLEAFEASRARSREVPDVAAMA